MKVGYAESLFANWSFLPRIFSRFGKINKDMGKKKNKHRTTETLHGSERHRVGQRFKS